MRVFATAVVLALFAAGCTSGPSQTSLSTDSHGAVVRLQLIPIPEGPMGPSFERNAPAGDKWVRPLEQVQEYMPVPFPAPLEQPAGCNLGGNLVVTFADGFQLTYGPCTRPPSIDRLWAGVIYVLEHGHCAPKCGPGGSTGP